jgi:hypothetical protein
VLVRRQVKLLHGKPVLAPPKGGRKREVPLPEVLAARVLGRYMSVDDVTVDHERVPSGPYRYVRHPVYGSFTASR